MKTKPAPARLIACAKTQVKCKEFNRRRIKRSEECYEHTLTVLLVDLHPAALTLACVSLAAATKPPARSCRPQPRLTTVNALAPFPSQAVARWCRNHPQSPRYQDPHVITATSEPNPTPHETLLPPRPPARAQSHTTRSSAPAKRSPHQPPTTSSMTSPRPGRLSPASQGRRRHGFAGGSVVNTLITSATSTPPRTQTGIWLSSRQAATASRSAAWASSTPSPTTSPAAALSSSKPGTSMKTSPPSPACS